MVNSPEVSQKSWFDSLKDIVHWDTVKEKFHKHQPLLIEWGLTFGIGFLAGFFIKKFGRLVATIVVVFVVLGILQQLGFISLSVDWARIHETLGIGPVPTLDESIVPHCIVWIKGHIIHTLLFILGFVLGLRLA